MPLESLLKLSEETSFSTSIKQSLLDQHKSQIYTHLKPQMGGFIDEESISISILNSKIIKNKSLALKCSVFYVELIGGCNCNDGPHAENGYSEIHLLWDDDGIKIINA